MERRTGDAIRAWREGGKADPRWAGIEALALTLARAIDLAAADGSAYDVVRLAKVYLEVLRGMSLDTVSGDPELDRLVAALSRPTVDDDWPEVGG
jgi:hypothetical protein